MDKIDFIKKAPRYYALAIAIYLSEENYSGFRGAIQHSFRTRIDDAPDDYDYLLPLDNCFDRAVELLVADGMIELIEDDFGPPIIRKSASFESKWDNQRRSVNELAGKYHVGGRSWLFQALRVIDNHSRSLKIDEADFSIVIGAPELPTVRDEWEPTPLDRTDPAILEILDRITKIEEEVRGNNGYGQAAPEERDYVLGALRQTILKFRDSDTISFGFIKRYTLEPLMSLAKRFAGAAIGEAANTSVKALVEWLRNQWSDWF